MSEIPKLSIIVPVYNVQNYLERCVESILCQAFSNFELILVDDGSTDDSGNICDNLALKDARIIVVHKGNGGLSSARNAGLEIIKGQYISFIDSDDYLAGDYYSKAISILDQTPCVDMVILQYAKIYPTYEVSFFNHKDESFKKGQDVFLEQFANDAYAWLKIYRRKIFEDIRYPIGRILEDLCVIPELFQKIDCYVRIQPQGYYAYTQREDSICHIKHTSKTLNDIAYAYSGIIKLHKQQNKSLYIQTLATYSSGYLNLLMFCPNHIEKDITDAFNSFTYSWIDIFVNRISWSQKLKLMLLKILGYDKLVLFYKPIYKIKHKE